MTTEKLWDREVALLAMQAHGLNLADAIEAALPDAGPSEEVSGPVRTRGEWKVIDWALRYIAGRSTDYGPVAAELRPRIDAFIRDGTCAPTPAGPSLTREEMEAVVDWGTQTERVPDGLALESAHAKLRARLEATK